jgi:hypothetical protein
VAKFSWLFCQHWPIVDNLIPVRTVVDVAVVDVVAIAAMLAGCRVTGLVARSRIGRAAYRAVDANLASLIPGYATLKARIGDAVGDEARRKAIKTIVVRLDDQSQLALEIERLPDGRVVAFLPSAPDPWSGTSVIVDAGRVTPLQIDILALTRLLKDLGSGTAAALQAAPRTPETQIHQQDAENGSTPNLQLPTPKSCFELCVGSWDLGVWNQRTLSLES